MSGESDPLRASSVWASQLRFAGLLAGGPALFHQTREFCAAGGTHAAAAPLLCGFGCASAVSRCGDPFEGCDRAIEAIALGLEFFNYAISVHGIPFLLAAAEGDYIRRPVQ